MVNYCNQELRFKAWLNLYIKLFIIRLFTLVYSPVSAREHYVSQNNALQLANQNARYIGYKHKPYNNAISCICGTLLCVGLGNSG